jgi:hypothetical protein
MMVREAQEYRKRYDRYVKSNLGMWTGLCSLYRVFLSPIYAAMFWYYCLKGVPMNFQVLHDEDYEPDERETTKCPQCGKVSDESLTIEVGVDK